MTTALVTCNSQTSNNQTRNTKNTGSIKLVTPKIWAHCLKLKMIELIVILVNWKYFLNILLAQNSLMCKHCNHYPSTWTCFFVACIKCKKKMKLFTKTRRYFHLLMGTCIRYDLNDNIFAVEFIHYALCIP